MSELWGSGNPTEFLSDTYFTAFDDHRYLKWDPSVPVNKDSYVSTSCRDDRNGEDVLLIGEWSLSVPDNVEWTNEWNPFNNVDFYRRWFAAQVQTYERSTNGWIFWTWKANLGDPRWSYKGKSDNTCIIFPLILMLTSLQMPLLRASLTVTSSPCSTRRYAKLVY